MLSVIVPLVLLCIVFILFYYFIDSVPVRRAPFRHFLRADTPFDGTFVTPPGRLDKSAAYFSLLNICLGDREKAERLIQFELRRRPGSSREAAILHAVDQVLVDNRSWRS